MPDQEIDADAMLLSILLRRSASLRALRQTSPATLDWERAIAVGGADPDIEPLRALGLALLSRPNAATEAASAEDVTSSEVAAKKYRPFPAPWTQEGVNFLDTVAGVFPAELKQTCNSDKHTIPTIEWSLPLKKRYRWYPPTRTPLPQ